MKVETIKKVISLEAFKNRFNHKAPYINEYGEITSNPKFVFNENGVDNTHNWGEIICDYKFAKIEDCPFAKIKDNLPLIEITENNAKYFCFRYKTMVYWYNWLINYGKTCKYYKLCKRNSGNIWVLFDNEKQYANFFNEDYNIDKKNIESVAYLPNINNYKIGDIIEVNNDADIFNKTFRVDNDEIRYELKVLDFIEWYFYNDDVNSENLSIPYTEIPVHITQTIDSLGILTSAAKEWNPSIVYSIGDTVLYKTDLYILYSGNSVNLLTLNEGDIFLSFCNYISNDVENLNYYFEEYENDIIIEGLQPQDVVYKNDRRKIYYKKENENIVEIKIPYLTHKANLNNKTGEYEFDAAYWKINEDECDEFNTNESGIILDGLLSGKTMTDNYGSVKVESKLSSLRRYKKTIDNDGNILPFILDNKSSMDTELPFNVGVSFIYLVPNDKFRGDVMKEIILESEDSEYQLIFKYSNKGKIVVNKNFYKTPNETIENEVKLTDNIMLYKNESAYTYFYEWVKNEGTNEKDETIELVQYLPTAEKKYLNKTLQTSAQTDNGVIYYINTCVIEKIKVVYETILDNSIMIKPSMLSFGNNNILIKKGFITFHYLKDCLLNFNNVNKCYEIIDDNYGLSYVEKYKYEISVAGVNLVSSKVIEEIEYHTYELYDYEITDIDEVVGNYWDVNTSDMNNVGNVYQVVNEDDNSIIGYKRLLSNYNYIHINFDENVYEVTSTDNENFKKNVLLTTVQYNINDIIDDNFQKDYVFKNEYTIGIENLVENIEINIERGLSSSFEKHHILSEIKSMSDLENYRNNLFKL